MTYVCLLQSFKERNARPCCQELFSYLRFRSKDRELVNQKTDHFLLLWGKTEEKKNRTNWFPWGWWYLTPHFPTRNEWESWGENEKWKPLFQSTLCRFICSPALSFLWWRKLEINERRSWMVIRLLLPSRGRECIPYSQQKPASQPPVIPGIPQGLGMPWRNIMGKSWRGCE